MSQATPPPPLAESPLSRIPFTAADEDGIKSLSGWMTAAGIIGLVAGVLTLVANVTSVNIGGLIGSVLDLIVSVWILQASSALKKVATTDVADQAYLVSGFEKLRLVFFLQAIRVIIGLVIFIALALFALVYALADRGGVW